MIALKKFDFLLLPLLCMSACSQNLHEKAASEALPYLVISPLDFDRNFNMNCQKNEDCTLPLVCDNGLCNVPPAILDRSNDATPTLTFKNHDESHTIKLEIVSTDYARQKGMMNRKTCAPNWGMLFVFPNEARRSFWMSHTYIPLDIIFIEKNGTVSNFYENAAPLDERPRYTSNKRVPFVLELPGGSIQKYHITNDTVFDMSPFKNLKAEF